MGLSRISFGLAISAHVEVIRPAVSLKHGHQLTSIPSWLVSLLNNLRSYPGFSGMSLRQNPYQLTATWMGLPSACSTAEAHTCVTWMVSCLYDATAGTSGISLNKELGSSPRD